MFLLKIFLLLLAEVGPVGSSQLLRPISGGLQHSDEKAQGSRFVYKPQPAHQFPVVKEPLHPVDDILRLG